MKERIMLFADEGKWITDGKNYGKTVMLAEGATPDAYYEVTDEVYREAKEKEAEEML